MLNKSDSADRLEQDYRTAILTGAMAPGTRIMPLREIARAYSITYGRAHRVARRLQAEGLLWTRPGGGTFVAERPAAASATGRPASASGGDAAMVVAPRFYWHLVETSWVLGIVRAFEASLHDRGATCRLVAEEDVAQTGPPSTGLPPTVVLFPNTQQWVKPYVSELTSKGTNVILVTGDTQLSDIALVVDFDGCAGVRTAVAHLRGLAHETIAFASWRWPEGRGHRVWWVNERREAYEEALSDEGIEPAVFDLPYPEHDGNMSAVDASGMLSAMLASRPRPTAVVAANDGMALAIVHACREQGVRVPEDLSVVGFDDVPEAVSEGLTTLRRPYDGLGRLAADMALLAGRPPNAKCRGRVGVEPDLVVRRSTCPPLAGGPRAGHKARGGRRRPG